MRELRGRTGRQAPCRTRLAEAAAFLALAAAPTASAARPGASGWPEGRSGMGNAACVRAACVWAHVRDVLPLYSSPSGAGAGSCGAGAPCHRRPHGSACASPAAGPRGWAWGSLCWHQADSPRRRRGVFSFAPFPASVREAGAAATSAPMTCSSRTRRFRPRSLACCTRSPRRSMTPPSASRLPGWSSTSSRSGRGGRGRSADSNNAGRARFQHRHWHRHWL